MSVRIQQTEDGSPTLYSESVGEHYHSLYGARAESMHIFIEAGLRACTKSPIRIFEVGMGTGLNAYLTLLENRPCYYETIEKYPIEETLACNLYEDELFRALHQVEWEKEISLTPMFLFHKRQADLLQLTWSELPFDVVYFDAFSPERQPEMWEESIFADIYSHMNQGGILTTYCAKGEVRRRLQRVGFRVERLPGPKGKREILRAIKD